MKSLRILDIGNNRISSLEGISNVQNLTDIWANDNKIESLAHVEDCVKPLSGTVTCIYLAGNPCALENNYKLRMLHVLPKLEQLDDKPI